MNLSELFELQAALDTHIEKEHPRQPNESRLEQKILALLVELGECANEFRGFKFWSNDKQPRQEKLLEEYVDCLHFVLSIGNEMRVSFHYNNEFEFNEIRIRPYKKKEEYFIDVYKSAIELLENSKKNIDGIPSQLGLFHKLLINFNTLGLVLGFTTKEIENAYNEKNKINHQRQLSGY